MPAILDRLVGQLEAKGKSKSAAFAIGTSVLQKAGDLKTGSVKPTPKGAKRGAMSPGARAKDRAAKASGGKAADFSYNAKTNVASKRPGMRKGLGVKP